MAFIILLVWRDISEILQKSYVSLILAPEIPIYQLAVNLLCQGSIYLVGWGTSLLIRKPVGINREAEAGSFDAVLRFRLVELSPPPLLLLLPLLPLLTPVASLLGTFRAELRRPWGGFGGGATSPAVFSALRGCCCSNLPANQSTNPVVMVTQCLSQKLLWNGAEERAWQLRAAAAWRAK